MIPSIHMPPLDPADWIQYRLALSLAHHCRDGQGARRTSLFCTWRNRRIQKKIRHNRFWHQSPGVCQDQVISDLYTKSDEIWPVNSPHDSMRVHYRLWKSLMLGLGLWTSLDWFRPPGRPSRDLWIPSGGELFRMRSNTWAKSDSWCDQWCLGHPSFWKFRPDLKMNSWHRGYMCMI
jgi:hypothetical protein